MQPLLIRFLLALCVKTHLSDSDLLEETQVASLLGASHAGALMPNSCLFLPEMQPPLMCIWLALPNNPAGCWNESDQL